jgi:1-acyl-sn-glycerol-3-phosphate acyltransferase
MFYNIAAFICRNLLRLFFRVEIKGDNFLGDVKGCIVYANHTSYLDPIVMGGFIKRPIRFMAKRELFQIKLLGAILKNLGTFPVRRGEADINAVKTALRLLRSGEVLGLYPEGTRNRSGAPMDAEPGLSMIAIKSKVPVIPVAIVSEYKILSPIRMIIGQPIYLEEFYSTRQSMEEHKRISNNLMKKIMTMIEEGGGIKQ